MAAKIPGANLDRVRISCCKHKCRTRDFVLHRHHKGHQYMFVAMWAGRRHNEPRYRAFVQRYYEYRDEDVVLVCSSHHREIHEIYDKIILKFCDKFMKPDVGDFSWQEAEIVMTKLVTRCNQWLKRQTKGAAPWPSNGHTKRRAEDAREFLETIDASARGEIPF